MLTARGEVARCCSSPLNGGTTVAAREWDFQIYRDLDGVVSVALYELPDTGQMQYIDSASFGPFDTATDVAMWLIRHWSPRASFPLS
jgi:hypothetical protein